MKNYSLNVNLTVGQSSEFYDGKLFVHVVTMISCENLEFQIGIADFIHGEDRSAMPISNILWQTSNYSVDVSALIAIQPTVVCPKSKTTFERKIYA